MDQAKQQLAERLQTATNILVGVSHNPSVDQLAALLGLTLFLNKQGKHGVAIFSGEVPSTIEFLKPEDTFQKTTDSLRDFIIALDKNKADKLRYKVEDNVVRIFITPYRTSINQDDLEFSQGDFNVDLVIALGVNEQGDIDDAITAHGRILHDATVASITTNTGGQLGSINLHAPQASSLSEVVTGLIKTLGENLIDEQIATALLTGIVSETDRFSNDKTTPETMSMSAILMQAGANQQLVANKLSEPVELPQPDSENRDEPESSDGEDKHEDEPPKDDDGAISIDHTKEDADEEKDQDEAQHDESDKDEDSDKPAKDSGVELPEPDENAASDDDDDLPLGSLTSGSGLVTEPPTLGGQLTANSEHETEPSADLMSLLSEGDQPQILKRRGTPAPDMTPKVDASMLEDDQAELDGLNLSGDPTSDVADATDTDNQSVSEDAGPDKDAVSADATLPPPPVEPELPMPTTDSPTPLPVPEPTVPEMPTPEPPAPVEPVMPPMPLPEPPIASPTPPGSDPFNLNPDDGSPSSDPTLAELEHTIDEAKDHDSHSDETKADVDSARDEVNKALSDPAALAHEPPKPIQALNAQPMGGELHAPPPPPSTPDPAPSQSHDPNSPPPVPPPIPFQFNKPPS